MFSVAGLTREWEVVILTVGGAEMTEGGGGGEGKKKRGRGVKRENLLVSR